MSVPVWPIKNDNHDEEGQRLIEKLLTVIIFLFPVKKKSTILARGAHHGCFVITLSIFSKNNFFQFFFEKKWRIFFKFFFLYYWLTFILKIHKTHVYSIELYTLILICTFCKFSYWKWQKIEIFENFGACCHYINNNFFDSSLMLLGHAAAIFHL